MSKKASKSSKKQWIVSIPTIYFDKCLVLTRKKQKAIVMALKGDGKHLYFKRKSYNCSKTRFKQSKKQKKWFKDKIKAKISKEDWKGL